ncbi:fimbrial protein [Bacteroides sp. 519]|uniref:fimbrial protein n=1 Tax=Bacteroides sp. 519 TaxID=2302937 RepID=UPI0013D0217D|nr:fimbrial protein [Bacteroides sp. 519]NDV57350.1 DUF4906 domain-containing protein [Bacteroides sp. 519]
MKKRYRLISLMVLPLLLLMACNEENTTHSTEDGQDVIITIATGSRSDGDDPKLGDAKDRYINRLRVMGYRISDGKLAFNEKAYGFPDADTNTETYEGNITVKTGKFTVVFIANEHADDLTATLDDITESQNNTLNYLKEQVTFSRAAFDKDKDIPMVTVKKNITIQGENKLIDPQEGNTTINKWPIQMERIGIKLSLTLTITEEQQTSLLAEGGKYFLHLYNVPEKAYLFADNKIPVDYNDEALEFELGTDLNNDAIETWTWERIILPENIFTPIDDTDKALTLVIKQAGGAPHLKAFVRIDKNEENYTLPRNTFLDMEVFISTDRELEFNVSVNSWNDEEIEQEL